jgi:succinoglycan biosynthesis transport protein ExoP
MSASPSYRMGEFGGVAGALLRRWWIILGLTLLCGAVAYALTAAKPKQYEATSQIVFRPSQLEASLFTGTFRIGSGDASRDSATNVLLASVPQLANRAAAEVGDLSAAQVRSRVSIASAGQSNVVNIIATDSQPARAARIANSWAHGFVAVQTATENREIAQTTRLLRRQLAGMDRLQRDSFVGESLGQRLQDLGVLRSVNSGGSQVIQTASVPTSPSGPKTNRNAALAAAVGLLLGLAVAVLVDRRILLRAAAPAPPPELESRQRSAA